MPSTNPPLERIMLISIGHLDFESKKCHLFLLALKIKKLQKDLPQVIVIADNALEIQSLETQRRHKFILERLEPDNFKEPIFEKENREFLRPKNINYSSHQLAGKHHSNGKNRRMNYRRPRHSC